ncbi:MAG: ParB N-terminal domain-containing protein [Anaerolineales bacterium]|nr:ParB N-terminal domain-containing protein [Anaerolineales bacterium]MCB9128997.1 ParB N-terminal domain-containing protein [Ardenticatenales bacterium]
MSQDRADRIRANFLRQGGRSRPAADVEESVSLSLGKRADERVISLDINELLPDRYQGRLRWPIEASQMAKLYDGSWSAQQLLDAIAAERGENDAVQAAWQQSIDLANSILAEGQVAPITVAPQRGLPSGYRFVIETGEGRYWAYHLIHWLSEHAPTQLLLPQAEWREDPQYIRAIAITEPSRLRQVAENEQRQSYASAIDRALAYASMLAEEGGHLVEGSAPGIEAGRLVLPEAYWRAARQGLRGKRQLLDQLPASRRQIQRHLKLLTALDPTVLASAKQHNLSEAQLRPLVSKPASDQRALIGTIVAESLSSREAHELSEQLADDEIYDIEGALGALRATEESARNDSGDAIPLTLPEEVAKLLRALARVAGRYESLRQRASERELATLIEAELDHYDEHTRGAQRLKTPRYRIGKLLALFDQLEESGK